MTSQLLTIDVCLKEGRHGLCWRDTFCVLGNMKEERFHWMSSASREDKSTLSLSPVPPLYSLMDQFWEELIMVCLFKQEEWPKILQCYGIFLYLFLPRPRGHCWNQDEFRQWGCSLLEASSILTVFSGLSLFLWLFSSLTEGFYPWLLGRHLKNPPNPLVLISKGLVNDRGFPAGVSGKNRPAKVGDARDTGSIPGSGRSPGEGNGNPLQYSCLSQNSMDRGAWLSTVHRVTKPSDMTEWVLREWQSSLLLHWASMRTNKTSSDCLKLALLINGRDQGGVSSQKCLL